MSNENKKEEQLKNQGNPSGDQKDKQQENKQEYQDKNQPEYELEQETSKESAEKENWSLEPDDEEKKGRKKRGLLLLLLLLLLLGAAAIVVVPRYLSSRQTKEEVKNVSGEIMPGLPDGMKEGEIANALQKQIDESMFTISVNTRPVFQNGNAKGKVNIINAPQNHYPCRVVLTMDEDGSVLYKNDDLLYPEQYIPDIKLAKNLKKGVYDATLTYNIFEEDGENQAGIMRAKVQLVIQN